MNEGYKILFDKVNQLQCEDICMREIKGVCLDIISKKSLPSLEDKPRAMIISALLLIGASSGIDPIEDFVAEAIDTMTIHIQSAMVAILSNLDEFN